MLEFLISLLLLILGLGNNNHPELNPQTIFERLEEKIDEVAPPQGNPQEDILNNVNPQNSEVGNSLPSTSEVKTFNTSSENYVGEIPVVAVENAPPLVECVDLDRCESHPEFIGPPIPLPSPKPITCIVPPPCIYGRPACLMPVPEEGWCPFPNPSPTP